MRCLVFLILRGMKNSLLELRRKPKKLAMTIVAVLVLVGIVVLSSSTAVVYDTVADVAYLKGVLFAFMTGDVANGVLFLGLLLLAGAGSVAAILFGKNDFYEDDDR